MIIYICEHGFEGNLNKSSIKKKSHCPQTTHEKNMFWCNSAMLWTQIKNYSVLRSNVHYTVLPPFHLKRAKMRFLNSTVYVVNVNSKKLRSGG